MILLNWKEVKSMDIRDVVKDPEWQALRKRFVGTWKSNADQNVIKLRKYVGDMKNPMKVRRVLNYLTGSGFRIGIIDAPSITELREEIRNVWRKETSK